MQKNNNPLLSLLAKDKDIIAYRPEFRALTDSVTAAILLQQIFYRWARKGFAPFYKFKCPCESPAYKNGDSWTEELGFSVGEFDTALDKIAVKVRKDGERPEDALVWYWVDYDRKTYYEVNEAVFSQAVEAIYSQPFKKIGKRPIKRGENGKFATVKPETGDSSLTPENGFTCNGETDLRNSEKRIYLHSITDNTSNKTTDTPPVGDADDFLDYEQQVVEQQKSKPKEKPKNEGIESSVTEIIEHLNFCAGRKLAVTGDRAENNREVTIYLLKKGYTTQEIKEVIELKCFEWGKNPKMANYLHPSTLFCRANFQKYLDTVNDIKLNPYKEKLFKEGINGTPKRNNGHNFDPIRTAHQESLLDP